MFLKVPNIFIPQYLFSRMRTLKSIKGLLILVFLCFFISCNDDEYVPVSPVALDLAEVPYPKLSDYHFLREI